MSQKIKTSVEIDGSLTANSIVKSGGTASQILAADGSVVTAGSGVTISGGTISASGSAGVLSFNTRTGAVTLTSGDVTTALGYTPYNASNPAGYTTNTGTVTSVSGGGGYGGLTLSGSVTTSGSLTLGGTPTGTWPIGISGNAATATNAVYANSAGYAGNSDTVDNYHASSFAKQAYVNVGYDFNTLSAENSDSAIAYRLESSVANPPNGSIYNWSLWQQGNSTRGSQIAVGAYGGNEIYFRGANNDSGSYRGWQRVLHDGNYSTYAVPTSRTITINGTTQDLSANRSFTVSGTVTSGVSITSAGSASNTPSTPSVNIGMYVDTYAFIDLATADTNGSWIDFSKANGTDYGGRIRYNNGSDYFSISAAANEQVRIFNSNAEALGSFRAPIFYDSNNTSYYLDPSSTSYSSYNAGGARFRNIEISNSTYTDTIQNVSAGGNIWLNYGHNGAVGLGFGGGLTTAYSRLDVNGTGTGTLATLKVNTSTATTFVHSQENMAANLTTGQHNIMVVGKEANTKNSGYIGYYWAGAASNANFVTIGHWGNDDLFRVYGSGEAVSTVNIQAPIFYDSNNTGYYVDPASTSNLALLSLYGHDNQLKINTYSGGAAGWFAQEAGVNKWETYHYQGRYRFYNYTTGQEEAFFDNANGFFEVRTSMRAPIFYDSNDTGYYADFNSTSQSSVRQRGGTLHGPNTTWGAYLLVGGNGRTGYINDGLVASVVSTDGNLHLDAGSGKSTYLNWYDGSSLIFGNGSEAQIGTMNSSGDLTVNSSMRAPIFYDSSDTGYYWNPNTDASHRFQTPSGYIDIGPKNSGTCHIYTDRSSFYFNKDILVNGSTVLNTSNAPRAANSYVMFYEGFTLNANDMSTNSTGFTYSNNAPWTGPVARFSTGGGYDLWLNASYGGDGTALSYRTRNGDAGTHNSWHRIYSDSYKPNTDKVNGYGGYDHVGSGLRPFYNWGGSNGGASAPNGSTYTNGISVGSHPSDPAYGFQIANNMWNTGLWTRSYNSYNFDGWVRLLDSDNYSGYCNFGGNTVYGAAFYDANDTAYYINPAGASSMSSVYASNWFRTYGNTGLYGQDYGVHFYPQNSQGWSLTGSGGSIELQLRSNHNSTIRGYVHADTSNNIGFLTNAGGWGIRVESNRNVHIHGDTLYISDDGQGSSNIIMKDGDNGDRQIHCNSDRIGFLTQSGAWGSYCADNGDWVTDMISWSGASSRAPIFYDSNDTGYYLDPASTSNIRNITVSSLSNSTGLTVNHSGSTPSPAAKFNSGGSGNTYGAITATFDSCNYGTAIRVVTGLWSASQGAIQFYSNTTPVGNIQCSTTTTTYSTTSDYRLKENVAPMVSSIERLKELNPCRFNFVNEPTRIVDGFIAHEVQAIIPEAVTGTKDEVDPTGTPVYQGIDQGKIVPLLTAALQDAIAKIEELENRLSILENK